MECIGGGKLFYGSRGTHHGPRGYIHGHRACWHTMKTYQARLGAATPINLLHCTWCLVTFLLYRVSRIGPVALSCYSRCPLSAKLISWTPCWGLFAGYLLCMCHLKYTYPCDGGGTCSCACSRTSSATCPSIPFLYIFKPEITGRHARSTASVWPPQAFNSPQWEVEADQVTMGARLISACLFQHQPAAVHFRSPCGEADPLYRQPC